MKFKFLLLMLFSLLSLLALVSVAHASIELVAPAEGYDLNVSSHVFTFNYTDGDDSQYCEINVSGVYRNHNSTTLNLTNTNFFLSSFSTGSHNWTVTCKDNSSVWISGPLRNFTVDVTAPVISNVFNSTTNESAVVSWDTDENANATLQYGLTVSLGTSLTNASFGTARSFSLTGLTSSTTYWYNITSYDEGGYKTTQGPYNFTTLVTDGVAPVISNVFNSTTNESAYVSWDTDENANATLQYGLSVSLGSYLTNVSFGLTRGFSLTGLVNSTTYWYNTTSCDIYGFCNTTGPYNFTTNDTYVNTSSPLFLSVRNVSITNVSAVINVSADASVNLSVEYGVSSSLGVFENNVSFSPVVLVYLVGLAEFTQYFYNVTICRVGGYCNVSGPYNFTTLVTDGVAPIISNITNSTTNESAVVSWDTDENANATLQYGLTVSLGTSLTNASFGTARSFSLTGLTNNTVYWFNITSCDIYGYCNTSGPRNISTLDNNRSAPYIEHVLNSSITNVSAIITVDTDVASNLSVDYGTTTSLGTLSNNATLATTSKVYLSGLTPNTVYDYNVTVCKAGNFCNTSGTYSFTTSTTDYPPTVTNLTPADGYASTTSTNAFNCTGSDDVSLVSLTIYIDGLLNETNSSPINASNTMFYISGFVNGAHTWICEATDSAGNSVNSTSRSITVTLPDTTAPTINSAFISNNYTQNSTSVTVTVNATDNVAVTSVVVNGTSLSQSGDVWSGTVVLVGTDGPHTLNVNASDARNNSDYATISFTIDDTNPVISKISLNDSVVDGSTLINLSVSVSGEDNTTISTVSAEGVYLNYNSSSGVWEGYITPTDTLINVIATDIAGNTDSNNQSIIIDNVVPSVSVIYPVDGSNVSGSQVTINYSLAGTGSNISDVIAVLDTVTKYPLPANSNVTFNLTFPGRHTASITAYDEARKSASSSIVFYSYENLNVSNWTSTINSSVGDVSFIQILDENDSDVTQNDSGQNINQNFTLIVNMSNQVVVVSDIAGNETSWSGEFQVHNYSSDLIQNVSDILGTGVIDMVEVTNFSTFVNESVVSYMAYTRLPMNFSSYESIYYCDAADLSDCQVVSSICGTAPCYVDAQSYVDIYVPHFSTVFGANDTVAPQVTISTPSENKNRSNSYAINLNITTNEVSTCSWKLETGDYTSIGTASSFSATFSNYTNGAHTLYVNCTDAAGNTNLTSFNFNISDYTPSGFASSSSPSAGETDFTFSFDTDEPTNHSIWVEGEGWLTNANFSISHSEYFSGLSKDTVYEYNISICDQLGNCYLQSSSKRTDSGDSGGGGGGGSTSSNNNGLDATFNPRKTRIFTDVISGIELTMTIGRDDIDLTSLTFTPSSSVSSAKIIVEGYGTAKPVSTAVDGLLYQYIQINSDGWPSGALSDILLKFRVKKSWVGDNNVDPSTIVLKHYYNYKWSELSTTAKGSDSSYYYFEAITPSFSNFAITGVLNSGSGPIVSTGVNATNTSSNSSINDSGVSTVTGEVASPESEFTPPGNAIIKESETTESQSSSWWIYVLIAVAVIAILGVSYYFFGEKLKAVIGEEKKMEEKVEEVEKEVKVEKKELDATKKELKASKNKAKEKFEVVYELAGGTEVRNIHELLEALNNMDDETFMNYVDDSKNDFATWVNNVFKDYKLASKISDVKTRQEMCRKIESHLSSLKISPDDEESKLSESFREHDVAVPKTDLTQLRRYVHLALSHGKSISEIRRKLLAEQWPEEIVDILLDQLSPK